MHLRVSLTCPFNEGEEAGRQGRGERCEAIRRGWEYGGGRRALVELLDSQDARGQGGAEYGEEEERAPRREFCAGQALFSSLG